MAEYQIPITYVVSASVMTPSAGLEPLKLSTILLLTDEQPINEQPQSYMIARTASAVAQAYGTEAEVTALAQTIYSQQPNILANDGYVIVAPTLADMTPEPTPATAGTLTTGKINSNVSNFAKVTDGVLNLTVDGTETEVTGLDFTGVTSPAEIADILQEKFTNVSIIANGSQIVFTSQTTGTESKVEIAEMTESTGTDLYAADLLNGATCTAVSGADEIVYPAGPENLAKAINRIAGQIYFEGILTTRDLEDSEAIEASNTVQAMQNRILFLPAASTNTLTASTGLFAKVASNYNTKCLLYTFGENETTAKANSRKFAAAYASRGFAVNYNGSNTTLTMNLKDLVGIQADTNISETILQQCAEIGADCFPSIEGLAKIISNKQGGQYFDQVANRIWFINSIQRAVFNVPATTSTKIPQTEPGIQKIINAIRGVCNQAVTNGMVAPGTWNSPDSFGNYDDFIRNIEEFGFYIYHQPIAEQAQAEREERKAPVIQIAAKEAGAVHSASILIYLEA